MFKLASGLIGLVLATGLFWLGIAWEHRPHAWPAWTVAVGPFHHTFAVPDGPYARLKALEANRALWVKALGQCQANEATLKGAIDLQNHALGLLNALAAQQTADNAKAVLAAQAATQQADQARATVLAVPQRGEACARYDAVHEAFTRTLP